MWSLAPMVIECLVWLTPSSPWPRRWWQRQRGRMGRRRRRRRAATPPVTEVNAQGQCGQVREGNLRGGGSDAFYLGSPWVAGGRGFVTRLRHPLSEPSQERKTIEEIKIAKKRKTKRDQNGKKCACCQSVDCPLH